MALGGMAQAEWRLSHSSLRWASKPGDYRTTALLAALNTLEGTAIWRCKPNVDTTGG